MKITDMKVELLDYMGSDLTVVNAARVSFNKESEESHFLMTEFGKQVVVNEKDAKLINYLAKHNHWTPFGHCYLQVRVKAPIFVARQLGKHQVGLVWNEVSRRYVDEEPEFYFPTNWRARPDGSIKQGSGDKAITEIQAEDGAVIEVDLTAKALAANAVRLYNTMIDDGVAPEQARMILPQNMMTEWWWSGSLAAFARICILRLDSHTQEETRLIAKMIDERASQIFPASWKALLGE